MDAVGFLETIRSSSDYRNQIACLRRIPAREAEYGELDPGISGEIGEALTRL